MGCIVIWLLLVKCPSWCTGYLSIQKLQLASCSCHISHFYVTPLVYTAETHNAFEQRRALICGVAYDLYYISIQDTYSAGSITIDSWRPQMLLYACLWHWSWGFMFLYYVIMSLSSLTFVGKLIIYIKCNTEYSAFREHLWVGYSDREAQWGRFFSKAIAIISAPIPSSVATHIIQVAESFTTYFMPKHTSHVWVHPMYQVYWDKIGLVW